LAPEIERPLPPYAQVVRYIRQQILDGELKDGATVPSIRQIADEWGISRATATKVVAALRSEGLVRSIQGVGTVVNVQQLSHAPRDRVLAIRRTGKIYPPDEHARITSAETVEASAEVAEALGVESGSRVIRRHRVTYRGDEPVSVSTSWFAGDLIQTAPRLLETERLQQGTPGYIEEVTGRVLTSGRDQIAAGAASATDAAELGVAEGSPVLLGRNWMYDQSGDVIEYGEYVSGAGRWSTYDYEVGS
jgi:DNA-binding GntR family transcriptional regulator